MRLLSKIPENRPQDWTEIVAELERILNSGRSATGTSPSPRGISVLRIMFFIGAALLLIASGILAYRYYQKQNRPLDIPELNRPLPHGIE